MENSENRIARRTAILAAHFPNSNTSNGISSLHRSPCLRYYPPETASGKLSFDINAMRELMDGHNIEDRDEIFKLIISSDVFCPRMVAGQVYVIPDYNKPMEHQREMTLKRILYLLEKGIFKGWLTGTTIEQKMRRLAIVECLGMYDHSLTLKLGVHFLWGDVLRSLGTKQHQEKFLRDSEEYIVKGCFAMTELGHGSNVRGIETMATYDPSTQEFIINTPCETAQKYWIGGVVNHATHTIVFSQLHINGKNEGVHAFIVQLRDKEGNIHPQIRIADCGHKTCLNGVDNGRVWFDNVRIPRENMLNAVADVSSDGQYYSAISDPDHRFGVFVSPLTAGRTAIAVSAVYLSKVALSIAIRYSLTRRAFNPSPDEPVVLLDYPSHQHRLLPLLSKTCAMSCAANDLKMLYLKRNPSDSKTVHVLSSGYKAMLTWHNMKTLQECREACDVQGLKTDNRIGRLKSEHDVQSTFEGDNNVLIQQVSKELLGEYSAARKKGKPLKSLGLEHMNSPRPVIPAVFESSALRSIKFQVDTFHLRERDLLERLSMEVSQLVSQGKVMAVAFSMSYKLMLDLASAFCERAILESVVLAETKQPSGSMKDILGLLRTMYALTTLEEDISFLRYGYLLPQQSQAISKEVKELCSELRPHALALVDSFGIPHSYLSPIAFDWIEANSWAEVQG